MGLIKSQGIKTSIVSYFGVLLGALNTLFFYPKFLTPDEIGLIALLTTLALSIAPLAQLGVNGIIIKYYPQVKNDEKQLNAFHRFIILLPTIGFIISMILLFLSRNLIIKSFANDSPLVIDYLFVLVPFSFVLVGRNVSDSISRAQFKTTIPKLYKEVHLRIFFFTVIILYYFFNLSLDFLVYGIVGAFGLNFGLVLFYLKKMNPISFSSSLVYLPKQMINESLKYGLFIILSGFAGMLVIKIDGYMIASKLGLDNVGIYTIALYIGLAIEMPKRSLNLISLPIIADAMKKKEVGQVKELYEKSALIQLILGSILLICVWTSIDQLFFLIPNSEIYIQGKYVVLFIGLGVLFDMATGLNSEIILMSNFYRWNLIIMLSLIALAVINNLLLIPIYGITGAAIATAISLFLFNIIKYILVYVKIGIQPFSIQTIKVLAIIILTLGISYILPSTKIALVDIVYKSTTLIAVYLFFNYKLNTSVDLVNLFNQGVTKVKKLLS